MELKEIGDLVKNRREVLGLTIRELASVTDISKTTISLIEKGTSNPTFEVLQTIFAYLNLEMKVNIKQRQ